MKKLLSLLLLFSFFDSTGQSLQNETRLPEAYDSAASSYYSNQSKAYAIYNGRVFYGYPGTKGHAFFPETNSVWQTGSIMYDDTWYYGVPLMFDVNKEEVLILPPNSIPIRLFSERVQKFQYDNKTFIRLEPDSNNVLKTAFYQQLVDGDATILVRRIKKIDEKIEGFEIERKFITTDQYYLLKDGKYHAIHSKNDLFRLLKDRKLNLGRALKQQQLKFKRDKEKSMVVLATFYNQSRK